MILTKLMLYNITMTLYISLYIFKIDMLLLSHRDITAGDGNSTEESLNHFIFLILSKLTLKLRIYKSSC